MLLSLVFIALFLYISLFKLSALNKDGGIFSAIVIILGPVFGVLSLMVPEWLASVVPSQPVIYKKESILSLGASPLIIRKDDIYTILLENNRGGFDKLVVDASAVEIRKEEGEAVVTLNTMSKGISFPWNLLAFEIFHKNYIIMAPANFELPQLSK